MVWIFFGASLAGTLGSGMLLKTSAVANPGIKAGSLQCRKPK